MCDILSDKPIEDVVQLGSSDKETPKRDIQCISSSLIVEAYDDDYVHSLLQKLDST